MLPPGYGYGRERMQMRIRLEKALREGRSQAKCPMPTFQESPPLWSHNTDVTVGNSGGSMAPGFRVFIPAPLERRSGLSAWLTPVLIPPELDRCDPDLHPTSRAIGGGQAPP